MKQATRHLLRDYGGTVLIAVVVALLIRTLAVEAYRIPSQSMRPALEPGDTIFVSKWPYGLRNFGFDPSDESVTPRRGDIVVFSFPGDMKHDYIKRVVALGGETVEIKQGRVSIGGVPLSVHKTEPAACGTETQPGGYSYDVCWEPPLIADFPATLVPKSSVFVLGDLRSEPPNRSSGGTPTDSLSSMPTWGIIPLDSIKGRAAWIWLSVEPRGSAPQQGIFPQLRLERMFRRIR